MEDDYASVYCSRLFGVFQSTSPVWRTTSAFSGGTDLIFYFNPRPPCGGRRPHLLCIVNAILFQSTSPVWRTTMQMTGVESSELISIHVPRVEDDFNGCGGAIKESDFNPRPPCGGRHRDGVAVYAGTAFQSTSPVWRTTLPTRRFHLS